MYKQQPKSPMLKALKGNQVKLPQQLQEKILASPAKQTTAGEFAYEKHRKDMDMGRATKPADKVRAALTSMTSDNVSYADAKKELRKKRKSEYEAKNPKSPAKQTTKRVVPSSLDKKTVNAARQMLKKSGGVNDPNLSDAQVIKAAKKKGYYADARSQAKQGLKDSTTSYDYRSPAKVKDPVTGSKVKGYAKSDLKVDRVRDKQERKATKAEKLATAKSDGKVTRLERKGIRDSQAKLKNEQVAKRNNKFQDRKVADKKHKERTKLRVKSKKLSDAVAVGLDKKTAQKKMDKAGAKANKRVERASKRAERRKF